LVGVQRGKPAFACTVARARDSFDAQPGC
jgi:hypothetical protein